MNATSALRLSVLDQSPVSSGASPADALENTIRLAKDTERLGYHRYWVAEHHGGRHFAASAPEILLARLGAEVRQMRIGSGAILLPHYSALKVAETFRTLEALYPGRVDLGIGRGQGGSAATTAALRSMQPNAPGTQLFPEKLSALLDLLGARPHTQPASRSVLHVSPETVGWPQIWLLGSSVASAALAAQRSLAYSFSHLFSPEATRASLEQYRANFVPSAEPGRLGSPESSLALGVLCADSEAEAERLFQTVRLRWHRAAMSDDGVFLSPEDADVALAGHVPLVRPPTEFPRYVYGAPEQVKAQLTSIAETLQVQELLVSTITHDPAARRRSYSLLAELFSLQPRGTK